MNFSQIPSWVVPVGLAAAAAILFLLQRLRVRYQPKRVVTTLFWKEAVEEARARVLKQRFRHPWAYALSVLLASLLWVAFAGPKDRDPGSSDDLVLIDASRALQSPAHRTEVLDAVERALADIPKDRRTVIWCGATPETLLVPGEEGALLRARVKGHDAADALPSFPAVLRQWIQTQDPSRPLRVVVAGADSDPARFGQRPAHVSVRSVAAPNEPHGADHWTLGVSPAASGAWDRVDALLGMPQGADIPTVTLDGTKIPLPTPVAVGGERRMLLTDLPALGGTLRVQSRDPSQDPLVLERVLPRQPLIRVALTAEHEALRAPLEADPGIVLVSSAADVTVGAGPGAGTDPTLNWVPARTGTHAIRVTHDDPNGGEPVLQRLYRQLGLFEVDVTGLATDLGQPVTLGAEEGAVRRIDVFEELLSDRYTFVGSRTFPLFLAESIRWLAGREGFPDRLGVGEPVEGRSVAHVDESGRRWDPVGASFVPPDSRPFLTPGGEKLQATVLDDRFVRSSAEPWSSETSPAPSQTDWIRICGVLALALLLVEWWCYRSGRMP